MTAIPIPSPSLLDRIHHRAFAAVANRSMLYNACWEDPALDREALALGGDDRVVVIASAGCNALDYALAGAASVDAVDINPRQIALLELKLAGIRHLGYEEFFAIFGRGGSSAFGDAYRDALRGDLSPFAQRYWDRRQSWFSHTSPQKSFYWRGLSGLAARLVHLWMNRDKDLRQAIDRLLLCTSIDQQRELYDGQIAPRLWTRGLESLIAKRSVLTLLGVPYAQRQELERSHPGGAAGFIRAAVDAVFRDIPLASNYFWRVYMTGSYERDCCPEYLSEAGFAALKGGLVQRVRPHVATLTEFLAAGDEPFSCFVLLDHMDWMGWYAPEALADEWRHIFRRASPDARIIFRSASPDPAWLHQVHLADGKVTDRLRFDLKQAAALHCRDRVHTYASFHIAHMVA